MGRGSHPFSLLPAIVWRAGIRQVRSTMAPWSPGLLAGPLVGLTVLPWLVGPAPVIAAEAAPVACPAPVTAQIAGLYRWQVARQNERGADRPLKPAQQLHARAV